MNQCRVCRVGILAGAAAVLSMSGLPARGADYSFLFETGGTPPYQLLPTGSWANAAHWTNGVLPGTADVVAVILPQFYAYDDGDGNIVTTELSAAELDHDLGDDTIGSIAETNAAAIRLSGGVLSLLNASTLNAAYTQTGGILAGPGDLAINAVATLNGGAMTGMGHTVLNGGGLVGNGFELGGGRVLENQGTLDFASSQSSIGNLDGTALFKNQGTLLRSSGSGTSRIDTRFDNSGTVTVASGGTLELRGGGIHSGTFGGAGIVQFGGGIHTLTSGVSLNNINLAATLSSVASYAIDGTADFYGGTLTGAGTTVLASAAASVSGLDLAGQRVLENRGVFELQNGSAIASSDGTGVLNNASTGTVRNLTSGTLAQIGATFNNNGVVEVGAGATLRLSGGGTHGGLFQGNGLLEFAGGTHTLLERPGGVTLNNVNIGGTLSAVMDYTIAGTVGFYGGTLNGAGTTILTGTAADFMGVTLSGGRRLDNRGTLDLTGDWAGVGSSDGTGTFVNRGQVTRTGTLGSAGIGVTFDNSGIVDLGAGSTLRLEGGGTHSGVFQGAGLVEFAGGTHTLLARPGGVTLNNVNIGSTLNAAIDYTIVGNVGLYSGTLSGAGTTILTGTATNVYGVYLSGGRTLENRGVFDFSGTWASVASSDGTGAFRNLGTVTRATTDAAATIAVTFDNSGIVDVAAGSVLQLSGGGTHSGVFQGAGLVEFSGGTHTLLERPGGVTLNNITIGGTLNAAVDYTIVGTAGFHGGTLSGSGKTTLTGATHNLAGLNLTGGRSLENDGTLDFTGDWAALTSSDGTGTFVNRGQVTRTTTLGAGTIGIAFDNRGTVEVGAGSTLQLGAGLTNHGTLHTGADAILLSTGLTNASDGILAGVGTITLAGGALTNAGTIAPGDSPGTLRVNGNLTLTDTSVLSIELAGLADHDRLRVSGQVVLDGSLDLSLFGGYLPALGDWFEVLFFDSLVGEFDTIDLNGFDPTLAVTVTALSDRLRLTVVAANQSIPTPSVIWLLLIGAGGWRLGAWCRGRPSARTACGAGRATAGAPAAGATASRSPADRHRTIPEESPYELVGAF